MTTDHATRPTPMTTLWLVTRRELRTRGTSRAYQIGVAAILLILTGIIVLPQLLASSETTVRIGILGEGSGPIVAMTESVLRDDLAEDDTLTLSVTEFADEDAARAAVAADAVELVVINGSEVLRKGSGGFDGSDVQDAVQQAAAITLLQDQLEGSGIRVDAVRQTLSSSPLTVRTLQGVTDQDLDDARSLIAYAGMMLLYLAILIYGAWTLQGVTEEKNNRVVEVLLACVKPWQLMGGKILGIGLLGLAQFAATVGWGIVLIRITDALPLPQIPVDSAVTLVTWFVLGFGLFSVLFATAGALSGRMEDAQSVSFPVSMVAIVGFLVSVRVLDDPSGTLAQIASFVPFVSPFVVPIRVAFGEIPLWQHLLAIAVSVVTTVGLLRVAARIYAGGALHFSGRLAIRRAWQGAEARR